MTALRHTILTKLRVFYPFKNDTRLDFLENCTLHDESYGQMGFWGRRVPQCDAEWLGLIDKMEDEKSDSMTHKKKPNIYYAKSLRVISIPDIMRIGF